MSERRMSWLAVDTETTGLDPTRHVPWEVAAVEPDGTEHVWMWRPSPLEMIHADPDALTINRFAERAPAVHQQHTVAEWVREIADLLDGNVLVGSNPGFDVAMLTALFRRHGRTLDSHYRPVDVVTLAAGWLHGRAATSGAPVPDVATVLPWSSTALSVACGVDLPDDDVRHTALADALWARELYLRIMGG